MSEPTINCPQCKAEIKLTESLAGPLVEATRLKYEKQIAEKESALAKRELDLKMQQKQLSDIQQSLEEEVANKVNEQLKIDRTKIVAEAEKTAKLSLATDIEAKDNALKDLQEILATNNLKLAEAQKAQAVLIKTQRELDDAKREMDLTIETKIQEGLGAARTQAKQEAEESLKLKVAEKEHTISAMKKQIEDLKRSSEQGSQQLQGEVQELELESLLKTKFPFDSIEPVPKGEHGGDALQRVTNSSGQNCGTIIWESKRTKNWSNGWLIKLRSDQRAANAEIAIMVSQAMPNGIENFDFVDGVWIVHPRIILPVAAMLRQSLIEVAIAKNVGQGLLTKTEMLFQYITGTRFRQCIEAIAEAFKTMKEDLDTERKVITKQWSKREIQIENVMSSTVGMYGEVQGIAGKSFLEIEGLEMKAITASDSDK